MLLSDFITVALIPSLITTNSGEGERTSDQPDSRNNRALYNSRRLPLSSASAEDDTFGDNFFSNNGLESPQPIITDPVLRDIYEEEKRLDLAGGDFDMRSEEARELIAFQRQKFQRLRDSIAPLVPQGRSLFSRSESPEMTESSFRAEHSTEYPILLPSTETSGSEQPETTTSTMPTTGRLGMGGIFSRVRVGVGNAVNVIKKPFWGSSSQTTSTSESPFSGGIRFPDQPNSIVFDKSSEPDADLLNLHCNGTKTQYQGECHNVLQEKPCSPGQWLVEDDQTGKGKCVENKCAHKKDFAFFGGQCVQARVEGPHCHMGMIPYVFKNGDVECDCKDQHLFNLRDGNCYPAYRRGPCNPGEIFVTKLSATGALPASCVKSKCSVDGFFCNAPTCPRDRNCIQLNSNCPGGTWEINSTTLSPACIGFDIHKPDRIIGNVPTLACAPGSRRDILGTCRKPSSFTFS